MAMAVVGLALLFFLGHLLNWFFKQTKIPDLLVVILIGYVLGPVSGIVGPADLGKVGGLLATVALVVILYQGGLNLRARDLLSSALPASLLSFAGFGLVSILTAAIAGTVGGQPLSLAILLGLGVGSTSSAIVIPMVRHLSIQNRTKVILSLESAFTDVLAIILFLVVVDAVQIGELSIQGLIYSIGPKTLLAVLYGSILGMFWVALRSHYAWLRDMTFSSEAWALLTYGLLDLFGLNGAIGVLASGFTLSNLDLLPSWMRSKLVSAPTSNHELTLLDEVSLLLRTFFFLYLGILVRFSNLSVVLIAVAVAVLIFVTRYLIVRLMFGPKTFSKLDAMVITSMGPRGLACAVLATIPVQRNIPQGEWVQNVIFAVIPLSIIMTAIFVFFSENNTLRGRMSFLFKRYSDPQSGENVEQDSEERVIVQAAIAEPTLTES